MSWREAFLEAVMGSWNVQFWPTVIVILLGAVYLRGFIGTSRTMPSRFPAWRAIAFLGGELVALLAIFSPLDALGGYLLSAHMVQHFLLLVVVPPLILLGSPAIPLLRGLPASVRNDWVGPFLASRVVRRIGHFLVHPVTGWTSMVAATWIWHVPKLYELALVDPAWHEFEHAVFLTTGILFWFPVIQPWPSRSVWPRWAMIPYLLLADLQNTIFSAFFAFSPRVIYPVYEQVTPALGIDPMNDQAFAGGFMWVPGSIAFLLPIAWVVQGMMRSSGPAAQRARLLGTCEHCSPDTRDPTDRRRECANFAPFRPPARSGLREDHRIEAWSPRHPISHAGTRHWCGHRRILGASNERDEPGGSPAVDALAWNRRVADPLRGKPPLHGVSLHPSAHARRSLPPETPCVPAGPANEMVGGPPRRRMVVVLRNPLSLGRADCYCVDHRGVLRRGIYSRCLLQGCCLLQVRLPHRSVPLRAITRLSSAGCSEGCRSLRRVHHAGVHSWQCTCRGVRNEPLPPEEGGQPRLHILPGLR